MIKRIVTNPKAIQRMPGVHDDVPRYDVIQLSGVWWLVKPETYRDIQFLQSLAMHDEKYAPGPMMEGILVRQHLIQL